MKRRDTIIVAVLINAGLLLILFATAIHGEKEDGKSPNSQVVMSVTEDNIVVPQESLPINPTDEVDQVLSQWSPAPTSSTPLIPQVMDSKPFLDQEMVQVVPQKTPPNQTRPSSNTVEVTVKKGDVLERIAKANGTSVQEIIRLNNLPNSRLKIGQILKIPVPGKESGTIAKQTKTVEKPKSVTPKKSSDTVHGTRSYTIKKGDSLWSIASKNNMRVDDLLRLNHLDEEKARRLKPGDQIVIR
ncbi:MAG: LysM peptidoglycan-binding domain-containing protein [Parachlamydiales bacterium]|nr:LysM peptidoglycan-binding domain-containing protein [Parachlamydiales bacterium]